MSRPRAETMPEVTVPPRPNGLPIATTQSPTRGEVLASFTKGKLPPSVTLRSATSVFESAPITLASSVRPSSVVTCTVFAPSTTWLLVTT